MGCQPFLTPALCGDQAKPIEPRKRAVAMDASVLEGVIKDEITVGWVMVAGPAFVVYDYVLTLTTEINFVWNARWAPGKILFFIVRYVPFLCISLIYFHFMSSPTEATCVFGVRAYNWLAVIQCLLCDLVMALRTWVLWERSKVVFAIVSLAWAACVSVSVYVFAAHVTYDLQYVGYPPGLNFYGCLMTYFYDVAYWTRACYYSFLAYELLILSMTLVRGLITLRRGSTAELLHVLYRDAFIGSLCFSAISAIQVALTEVGEEAYAVDVSCLYFAVKAVFPGRIILNVRESVMKVDGWEESTESSVTPTEVGPTASSWAWTSDWSA